MSFLFDRPNPTQAVPSDLGGLRTKSIDASQQALHSLLGLSSDATPGGDVLGPLNAQFNSRLNDQLSQINATGGRFSSGNQYASTQLRQHSLEDYNVLAQQTLEQGRNRQLQSIMALLGPVLGPTFGGPFTQGASLWQNLLGGVQAVGSLIPGSSSGNAPNTADGK